MTTTKKFLLYALVWPAAVFLLLHSCKKEDPKDLPGLVTDELTEITQITAVAGGSITDDGGAAIITRGVCWSTGQNPTIQDNKTEDGQGTGSFVSLINGLKPGTLYYVRAYATNSEGTAYGNTVSFTTLAALDVPGLTTADVSDITQLTALAGGHITDDGGAPITARGVCWSTTENPTLESNRGFSVDGTGMGSFVSQLTALIADTTYYVRAYATNSQGTAYGNQLSFQTKERTITHGQGVTDIDGNEYPSVIIGEQEWMAVNLRTTRYQDGTTIPSGHSDTEWMELTTGAYAVYPHTMIEGLSTEAEVLQAYGALYNWYALAAGELCPAGWRVPTDDDWKLLEGTVDSAYDPGHSIWDNEQWRGTDLALKLKSRSGWQLNGSGSDIYGFAALPAGMRLLSAETQNFQLLGMYSYFWTSTEENESQAWSRRMYFQHGGMARAFHDKGVGYPVRCLRE